MLEFIDYKIIFWFLSVIIGIYWYWIYIVSIFKKETTPHIFSWFVWALLTLIWFFGQLSDNAGAWAWVTWFTGAFSVFIFFLCFFYWSRNIKKLDFLYIALSLFSLLLWHITETPLYSMILIALVDFFGSFPTYRKVYEEPDSENLRAYFYTWVKWIFWIIALSNFSVITVVYPLALVFINWITIYIAYLWSKNKKKLWI